MNIEQETKYPWEGNIKFKISTKKTVDFTFKIRVPGWAQNQPVPSDLYSYIDEQDNQVRLFINNEPAPIESSNGFITITKRWKDGDVVELVLPMAVNKVIPNENVKEIAGKIAIERGPIVYCAEQVDNPDGVLSKTISADTRFKLNFDSNTLEGVVKLESEEGLTMVPYYAWSHRGLGEMAVWFARE